jgi:hypothetical protein
LGVLVLAGWISVGGLLSGCANKKELSGNPEVAAAQVPEPPKPKASLMGTLFGWTSVFSKLFPKKPEPPAAVPPQLLGEIRQVNGENQFVLIDASVSSSAKPGDALVCISGQKETASLRLTPLRSASFLIADIESGTPSVGDRVYRR